VWKPDYRPVNNDRSAMKRTAKIATTAQEISVWNTVDRAAFLSNAERPLVPEPSRALRRNNHLRTSR
jgi:hypothetical protein